MPVDDRELVRYFADLAGRLMAVDTVEATMRIIVDASVDLIDDCDHASISHIKGKALVSASRSDTIGIALDGIQTGADEGPCLDAIRTGEITHTADLARDDRWSTYGPRAVDATGVQSSVAFPLLDGTRVVGALNLFSDTLGALVAEADDDSDAVASILAAHATPALVAALFREDMQAALASRDVIGQAKGILMARSGIDEDAAFAMLKSASQRMQVKLAEVARRLVAGELGGPPTT
jgi:GAF domain-containing protein